MNEIDRLAHWVWGIGSEKENLYKNKESEIDKPKGLAPYDQWVNKNILGGIESRLSPLETEMIIDKRLALLREWVLLLRLKGRNGQVIKYEQRKDRTGKIRNITFDLRNFEAFCRYKENDYKHSALNKILR